MHATLLFYICFAVTTCAFNISIENNPPVFADVPLSWTRTEGDTDSFWFNELQIADDGSLLKVLSLQVGDTGSPNGTMTFVFIRTGSHLIQAIDDTGSAFFNSTPITAVAANSSGSSSCTPVTSTIAASSTGSSSNLDDATSHSNSSVVIGATIGTIVPLTIILAVIAVMCVQRRTKKWEGSSGSDSPMSETAPNAFSTAFARLTGSRNPNETITPFVAIPEFHPDPLPDTTSSFYPPLPSSFGEKMVAARSQNAPISPVTTQADDTEQTRSQVPTDVQVVRTTSTLAPLTQRQQLLEEEASRLRLQIMSMVNSALSSGPHQISAGQNIQSENRQMVAEMERMRAQIEMLEQDRDSSWARGLSDEPPSYLNSIG
ncbi:hypothetical protein J3R30DRAFT_3551364, partial [Lentinula aciculospora]